MSDGVDQPINLGIQYVHKDHYDKAIDFINVLPSRLQTGAKGTLTSAQSCPHLSRLQTDLTQQTCLH